MIPLLLYISTKKDKTEDKYFGLLGGLTLMIPLVVKPIKKYDFSNLKYFIPYLYQIPILLYVSYNGKESHMFVLKMLKGIAILQIILNLYFIYERIKSEKDKEKKLAK
tara:strand:- start:780 stop:1103 length:324 start_codon:yes stop_codon:yes gene_type:complete